MRILISKQSDNNYEVRIIKPNAKHKIEQYTEFYYSLEAALESLKNYLLDDTDADAINISVVHN